MSTDLIAEEYTRGPRSPPLSPVRIDYTSVPSPPPTSDPEDPEAVDFPKSNRPAAGLTQSTVSADHTQPSLSDSLLIRNLGPDYPEIAVQAAREAIAPSSEGFWEDRKPDQASTEEQMVHDYAPKASRTSAETQVLSVGALAASHQLNAALGGDALLPVKRTQYPDLYRDDHHPDRRVEVHTGPPNGALATTHAAFGPAPTYQPPKMLNVKPPPRISLPSIRTISPGAELSRPHRREYSMNTSPVLAKYTIAPDDVDSDQHLPKLNNPSPTLSLVGAAAHTSPQTLPSLETALSAISAPSEPTLSGRSPSLTRPSPAPLSHFGPSPSTYSNTSPGSAISPPRFSTAPSYWRTTSRDTVNSTPSDHASATTSNGVSTPASSVPGHSPAYSGQTPATVVPEHDARYLDDQGSLNELTPRQTEDPQLGGALVTGTFRCAYPGCNALPFQTQYLLNSHANVHSNTRTHFCPVEGCPRGPAGQGFKRKNEMIRHGLVHQSPGYVCPFCPDQQHKYPRPDNLQRHVRVHHVDRDRDDPLLREVLAQRPEGGNRGRRRRLGS